MRANVHYLTKREKVYYYQRRIPSCLISKYSKSKIYFSLNTCALNVAKKKATVITHHLDKAWGPLILEHACLTAVQNEVQTSITLDQAIIEFLEHKKLQLTQGALSGLISRFKHITKVLSKKPICEINNDDVRRIFEYLIKSKKLELSTIKNLFSSYRALYDFSSKLHGYQSLNPFNSIKIPHQTASKHRRLPFNQKELISIIARLDTSLREHQAIGLMINTGMRLNEVCGLSSSEIIIDCPIPHIHLRPTAIRRLKSANSERKIPLVGVSLRAAIAATSRSSTTAVFPHWTGARNITKSAIMDRLNDEIRTLSQSNKTSHCFRHALRDRLREVDCTSELIDSIGGWSHRSIGQTYGEGYSLAKKKEWLDKVDITLNELGQHDVK